MKEEERGALRARLRRGEGVGGVAREDEVRGLEGWRDGWEICRHEKKREVANVGEEQGSLERP
jgi:hypothetical protein